MDDIQILMAVYDGAPFLPDQLRSLSSQSTVGWRLLASDDSGGADSRDIIERFAVDVPQQVRVIRGPKSGFAANYLHLIRHAEPGPVAFADQDDVWLPDKLARAREALDELPADRPGLYCARLQPWNGTEGDRQRPMPKRTRPLGLENALIENVAAGNTIVLNRAAAEAAREMAPKLGAIFAHDWWLYQLVSGIGGTVVHDNGPPVALYRQHGGNLIGAGRGPLAQIRRKRAVLRRAFAERLTLNAAALEASRDRLTARNAELFDGFEAARRLPLGPRLAAFRRLGVYRQSPLGTAGFFGAAALGLV